MGAAPRIGLVAGEVSGDRLGAELIEAVLERRPDVQFEGIAGRRMRAAGCRALGDAEQLAVMGFAEVVRHLPGLLRLRRRLRKHFSDSPPQLFLGIDAPDFNLPLERHLKQQGIATMHWVSPSVWAWRRKRVKTIAHSVDRMLTLFPFEADFYREQGVAAEFVGHPLADAIESDCQAQTARRMLGLDATRPCVALLPGSRRAEIERLLPLFLASAVNCSRVVPDLQFVLPVAGETLWPLCRSHLGRAEFAALDITPVDAQARTALCAADAVLLASGTAALECMLVQRPMVVAYRMHPLSYALVKRMLRVPYVSLPNNLLGRGQVPEYLQAAATPTQLSAALLQLLQDPDSAARQIEPFAKVRASLRRGSAARVADIVLSACA